MLQPYLKNPNLLNIWNPFPGHISLAYLQRLLTKIRCLALKIVHMAMNYYASLYSCCLVFIFYFACTVWDSADSLLFHWIKFNVAICRNLIHLHTNISTCIQIHNLNLFANTFATNKFQPSTYHQYFFTWLTINLFFVVQAECQNGTSFFFVFQAFPIEAHIYPMTTMKMILARVRWLLYGPPISLAPDTSGKLTHNTNRKEIAKKNTKVKRKYHLIIYW